MKKQLLSAEKNHYKANLHCHTTFSDGKLTPEQVKALYREKGYSVVAFTDHDILVPHDELNDGDFLALHGFEVEIFDPCPKSRTERKCCHLCMIGLESDNLTQPLWNEEYLFGNTSLHKNEAKFNPNEKFPRSYDSETINKMISVYRENGFFVTYNHPTWSNESYPEYMSYHGMNAVEMFNGSSTAYGYEEYNPRVYRELLSDGRRLFCIGGDDNHNFFPVTSGKTDSGIAFTVIFADSLDYRTVTKALEKGDFFASEAPMISSLWYEDGTVHIECSPCEKIICTTQYNSPQDECANDVPITSASFRILPDDGYFRMTVIDEKGRHACTNAYFPEDF